MSADDTTSQNARHQLEDALTSIQGIAYVLLGMVEGFSDEADREAISYIGHQLLQHERDAFDAFRQIFHLDQYSEEDKTSARNRAAAGMERSQ
jgi:hypothetical protein